jgi:hypothetical protein
MLKPTLITLARIVPVLVLFSCAAPKATAIAEPPAPKQKVEPKPEIPEPPVPAAPDDGIRLPDMMTMPGNNEFRPANPGQTAPPSGSGPVIARPPTEPPPQKD